MLERLKRFWAFRSLGVGAVCTVVDLSLLLLLVEVLGQPKIPSVLAGVITGATVGFLLNKYFAFQNQNRRVGWQAVKYAVLIAAEIGLHNRLTSALVLGLGFHYLPSKFAADFLVFTCLHLVALRYLVFGRPAVNRIERARF